MKNQKLKSNMDEYGDAYGQITFPSEKEMQYFDENRSALIDQIGDAVRWGFGDTKSDCNHLSNGCQLCGDGMWSCLFINGECNCDCFYCPTSQDEKCLPTTNSVSFNSPDQYVAYLREMGFKGASISGGEPLLTFELTLSYVTAIKKAFGADMYVWMYTNGSLVTRDILHQLRDAGLDEIRFDIGATDYNIKKLKLAIGVIPVVTVEIPAVPEDVETMKQILAELNGQGLDHLNLHQLRLTPYNFDRLMARNYSYTHGEKVTVIESELAALELMLFVHEQNIDIPINYCSFPFKNRYQGLASRNRNGKYMVKDVEMITDNGFIRLLTFIGDAEKIAGVAAGIPAEEKSLYIKNRDNSRISIHPSLLHQLDVKGLDVVICYFSTKQMSSLSYRNPFKTIKISEDKNMVIERFKAVADFPFNGNEAETVLGFLMNETLLDVQQFEHLLSFETTQKGLMEYY